MNSMRTKLKIILGFFFFMKQLYLTDFKNIELNGLKFTSILQVLRIFRFLSPTNTFDF